MDFNIVLAAPGLRDETIQHLTRQLCTTINQGEHLEASIPDENKVAGTKGDPITIGTIVLGVLGAGGGAAALINVFKSYLDRSKELCIKVKRATGDEIEITSKNIDSSQIKSTLDEFLARG
jgi:hypothetical protein